MSNADSSPTASDTSQDTIRAVDLFCGAGALSWAVVEKLEEIALDANEPTEEFITDHIELVGINHWETAIQTHKQNHPWARHYHDDIQAVNPSEVFDDPDPDVTILTGGIECTHWSSARGGKPVDEQKRMPAWDFLTWVQKLRPDHVLVENVKEFCFPADSMVLTEYGPVPIQDVGVGTKVLTHKGRWKEVTDTTERRDETVTVTGRSDRLVECTPNHHFWTREIDADCWGGQRGRHVQAFDDPEWVPADQLIPDHETSYEEVYNGHYWSTPRRFGSGELEVPEKPHRIKETDEAFWRMIGLWLGDGWFDKRGRPDPPHGLRIAGQDPALQDQLEEVKYLSWNKQVRKQTDTYVYETTAKDLAHWIKEHFGEYAHGKTIPAWALALPEGHRKALIEGYQQADGWVDSYGRVSATTVSKQLVVGIKHLLESIGVAAGLPGPVEPDNEEHRTKYTVTWDWGLSIEDNDDTFEDGGHRWTRVVDTEPAQEETTVYDLTVADDHSFVVDGVVAHNSSWGPIEDGEPTRNGETFDSWIDALHRHGYSVDWETLNAADYGDATSRERLFILATRDGAPSFPEPTHSEDGHGDTDPYRTAADIIDWSDPGGSIWTRDLDNPRVRPLKNSTMQRIAEGIRRHCDDRLEPLADALADIGREDVKRLRENPVPAWLAPYAAQQLDDPFLVERPAGTAVPATPSLAKFYGTSTATSIDTPIGTITSGGNKYGHCIPSLISQHRSGVPRAVTDAPLPTVTTTSRGIGVARPTGYLLRQQSDGVPPAVTEPVPTISSRGAIGKVETQPLVMPRNGAYRGLHSNPLYTPEQRPLHTVTAKNPDGYLVRPSLIRYSHGGATLDVDTPMPTIATERGGVFSLSTPTPYLCPMYNSRSGQAPRTRRLDRPLMTIPASKSPAGLATLSLVPFIDDCQGPALPMDEPLGTQTATEKYALVVPDHYPWGLDVRYRMLQPHELKRAQGFPDDYTLCGTKSDRTEQIGNAVPVNLAKALVESLLTDELPSLTDYIDNDTATPTGSPTEQARTAPSDD